MGLLTRGEIVAQGMVTAGRDDLASLANVWLQNWLNSVAAAWDWAVLRRESVVPLSAQQIDFGTGEVLKVHDELWWYTNDRTGRGRIRIRDMNAPPVERFEPPTVRGPPETVRILRPSSGIARLSFDKTPDQTYQLHIAYQTRGGQLAADTEQPWYENDETMIQAVAYKTHEYSDGKDSPVTVACQQMLSALLNGDKYRFGIAAGQNNIAYKDPAIFPRSRK